MERREITRSQANYLKTILLIRRQYGDCRAIDIAEQTGYSKASVSVALKKLEEGGYIVRDNRRIYLSESGAKIAESICDRQQFFAEWFRKIGISPEISANEAHLMEHVLSDESFEGICSYLKQIESGTFKEKG